LSSQITNLTYVIEFREGRVDTGDGGALEAAYRAEMARVYDGLDVQSPDMPAAGAAELNPPRGAFLVGYQDGEPICCGGIKDLGPGVCELKRMYVVPEARGRGIARKLLGALEDHARELGYGVMRLDTGDRQPHARKLYESEGYAEIGNFNKNPVATFFGEKRLSA
jgi:GNAT superfamily N-acetyltransferase